VGVDLSGMSDDDLMALKGGDLSKVSDNGLLALKGRGPDSPYPASQMLADAGKTAWSAFTHAVTGPMAEGVAGLAARFSGHDPDAWSQKAHDLATYTPAEGTVAGDAVAAPGRALAPVGRAVSSADQVVDDFVRKYGGEGAQQVLRQASGTAGDILKVTPLAGAASEGVNAVRAATRAAEANAVAARTPDEMAKAMGLRVRPSTDVATTGANPPSTSARVGEALGGSSELARDFAIHNKPIMNEAIASDAGVAPGYNPSTIRQSLTEAEKPHAEVYRRVEAALPDQIVFDKDFRADVGKAGERENSLRPDPTGVDSERAGALQIKAANGAQLKATIADYRAEGYRNLKSDTDAQWAKGAAQLDIANALEAQMQRALENSGNGGLAFEFQRAREGFAKIHTAREVLVGNDFDLPTLARLADNNPGITGNMKLLADLHRIYPKDVTNRIGGGNPWGGHTIASGVGAGLGYAAGHALGGPVAGSVGGAVGLMAGPMLRKGIRSIVGATRGEAVEPGQALAFALADRAPARETAGFSPSQQAPAPPAQPQLLLERQTQVPNDAINPQDSELAHAIASRHPGAARESSPRPLALPAPGELAPRHATAPDVTTMSDRERVALLQRERSAQRPLTLTAEPLSAAPRGEGIPLYKVAMQPKKLRTNTVPATGARKMHIRQAPSSVAGAAKDAKADLAQRQGRELAQVLAGTKDTIPTLTKAERARIEATRKARGER
jgi:hypothetical protein